MPDTVTFEQAATGIVNPLTVAMMHKKIASKKVIIQYRSDNYHLKNYNMEKPPDSREKMDFSILSFSTKDLY